MQSIPPQPPRLTIVQAPAEDLSDDACIIEGGARPLVPPGEYQLRFDYWQTAFMFGPGPKLILKFTIISMGEYFNKVQLARFHNVKRFIGKPQRHGKFQVGPGSKFVKEYARLFPDPKRLDRISMSMFRKQIIWGRVDTVKIDSEQRKLPVSIQYSVISELLRVEG